MLGSITALRGPEPLAPNASSGLTTLFARDQLYAACFIALNAGDSAAALASGVVGKR